MTFVLITGTLSRLEERTSKTGRPFTMATLREKGDDGRCWRVFAFSETVRAELSRLRDGDAVALQGAGKFELYRHDDGGEPRLSLSVSVDQVLALKPLPKEAKPRKKKAPPPEKPKPSVPTRAPGDLNRYSSVAESDLDDALPF